VYGKFNPIMRTVNGVTEATNVELGNVYTVANVFSVSTVQCTPAVVGSWIGYVAAAWSKYRWKMVRFIYMPLCSTSTFGLVHMGLQYDNLDTNPASVTAMSSLAKYTVAPVWSGFQVAPVLSSFGAELPEGSVVVDVDVTKFEKAWYSYVTSAAFTAQSTIAASLGTTLSPARLVIATSDGSGGAINAGRLIVQYIIELIEPTTPTNNV